jgi:hypothetical protein
MEGTQRVERPVPGALCKASAAPGWAALAGIDLELFVFRMQILTQNLYK